MWDIMTGETTQRHLQMLLIVSSFGESRRRVICPAAAFLTLYDVMKGGYFRPGGSVGLLNGKTMKKVLPCPRLDSTQMRP